MAAMSAWYSAAVRAVSAAMLSWFSAARAVILSSTSVMLRT